MRHTKRAGIFFLAAAMVLFMAVNLGTSGKRLAADHFAETAQGRLEAAATETGTLPDSTGQRLAAQAPGPRLDAATENLPFTRERSAALALFGLAGLLLLAALFSLFPRRGPFTPAEKRDGTIAISSKNPTLAGRTTRNRGWGTPPGSTPTASTPAAHHREAPGGRPGRRRYTAAAMFLVMGFVLFGMAGHIAVRSKEKAEENFIEEQGERLTRLAALTDHRAQEARATGNDLAGPPLPQAPQGEVPFLLLIVSPTEQVFFDPAQGTAMGMAIPPGSGMEQLPAGLQALIRGAPKDGVQEAEYEGKTFLAIAVTSKEGWRFLVYVDSQALYAQKSLQPRKIIIACLVAAAGLFLLLGLAVFFRGGTERCEEAKEPGISSRRI